MAVTAWGRKTLAITHTGKSTARLTVRRMPSNYINSVMENVP